MLKTKFPGKIEKIGPFIILNFAKLVGLSILTSSPWAASLVVNGDFESPALPAAGPGYLLNVTPTGWQGQGDLVLQGWNRSVSSGSGAQWLDLNPGIGGSTGISQGVAVTGGTSYRFSFLYNGGGGAPQGATKVSYSVRSGSTIILSGDVSTVGLETFNDLGHPVTPWQRFAGKFVAPLSGTATVTISANGSWAGGFIDNVDLSGTSQLSCGNVVAGGVARPSKSGNRITTTFTPNFNFSLTEAASICGVDHFNWVQYATKFPGQSLLAPPQFTPFIDPPPGGLNGALADFAPYYWDETSVAGAGRGLQLSDNITNDGRTLSFLDIPKDPYITPLSGPMNFRTFLVGVVGPPGSDDWIPFYGFDWSSDYNPLTNTGGIGRNIEPHSGGIGGILDITENLSFDQLPAEEKAFLIANGAVQSVPWPPSALLLAVGLLCLVTRYRLRRVDAPSRIGIGIDPSCLINVAVQAKSSHGKVLSQMRAR